MTAMVITITIATTLVTATRIDGDERACAVIQRFSAG
jgi:hypothetical protein